MLTKLKNKQGFTLVNPTSKSKAKGFTLVELLIVIAILSILVSIALVSFRSSQARGRDAQRKSNLKQVANALELFYSDYGKYPDDTLGAVQGCPYDPSAGTGSACTWGSGELTDNKTSYFKIMPADPKDGYTYVYRIVDPSYNQKYQLFAALENTQDKECLDGDCANPPVDYDCGTGVACNFAITSSNTSATE